MASSSAPRGELPELKEKLKGLEEQKAAVLVLSEIGPRDLILLGELNQDLDRVQAAITALSSGELHFLSQLLPHNPLWYSLAVCKGIQLVANAYSMQSFKPASELTYNILPKSIAGGLQLLQQVPHAMSGCKPVQDI